MTWLSMLFVLGAAALLQALTPCWSWLGQAAFPFLLSAVVYYALARTRAPLLLAALAAGLLQDALSAIPLGYSSFCFCVAGALIGSFREEVFAGQWLTHMLFGALAGALATALLYVLLTAAGVLELAWWRAGFKVAGAALLGALVTPPVCAGLHAMERLLGLAVAEEEA